MKFEIKDRDTAGRICNLKTKHGTITTPNLMPVINPNKMLITPSEMKELFQTEIVITNSYIIKKDKKLEKRALEEGVHSLIDFDGPVMTDSGAFQSYMYGDIKLDPVEIVEFQKNIGSDIGTILDIFGRPDQSKKEAEEGIKETIKRSKKSLKVKGEMNLACTIQGSIYPDLRKKCAEEISKTNADFYPIGGVVPLMEDQRYLDLTKIILSSKKALDPSKPVHLFGAGHPLIFPLAVALGCDLFDSSAYAKYAQDGRMIFPWGTERIEDLSETACCCPVCSKYNIEELKKIDKKEQVLQIAKHNLYISFNEIKKIRNAIKQGNLWELVERKARLNPYLLEALEELKKEDNKKWLEQFEPISKNKALFYTGRNTIHRPLIYRWHKRLIKRYKPLFEKTIVFPEGSKPYSLHYKEEIEKVSERKGSVNFLVNSSLGPIPFELDEMYPFAQSIIPNSLDKETEETVSNVFNKYIQNQEIISWDEEKNLEDSSSKNKIVNMDIRRISAVADIQFGKKSSECLFKGNIDLVKSKNTGKIRNVYVDNQHLLSMRATDGMFTLKIEGAKRLHRSFSYPKLRVVIEDDAVPYVKKGKSVFAKFVKDCDSNLRAFDECLIVDKKDNLVAVGRCLLNKKEMESFNFGVAAKTREGISD